MIDTLLNAFFKNTIYIKFSSNWMSVKHIETGRTFEDKPLIALHEKKNGKKIIVAVGADSERLVGQNNTIVCNGFDHPRVCISDFAFAEATLKHFLVKTLTKKIMLRPIMIIHPLKDFEGGISQIECRALRELAIAAGSRETFIWTGRELKDKEMIALSFPESEGSLNSTRSKKHQRGYGPEI